MRKDRVTAVSLVEMKAKGEKIAALTAYEFIFATVLDAVGVDVVLVGDTLGMVFAGHETTVPVTVDQMIYHTKIVSAHVHRALVVGDMPFMSFQVSPERALENAGRFIQEGGAGAVKMEGGAEIAETVRRIVGAGIPVMGHLGLLPQAIHRIGGLRVQGRTEESACCLMADAKTLQEAGAFALVLEAIPYVLAQEITAALTIPTIGIGAGPHCDGQILVTQDMLGLFEELNPKYLRKYARLGAIAREACRVYVKDVKGGDFPSLEESYK